MYISQIKYKITFFFIKMIKNGQRATKKKKLSKKKKKKK